MPVTSTGSSLGGNGTTARWAKLRRRILERDGYVCAYCQGKANSVDHIIPRAVWPDDMPGVDDPSNLVAACKPCNSKKGSKIGAPPREKNIQRFTSREW
jgi:5-methylcytosine-specific restriction endonuclease McrA